MRDQTAEIENDRCDESSSRIASSETSLVTVTSGVDQRGHSAMPHHSESDDYIAAAPLSPLRPVFRDLLFTSVAAQEAGPELIGMTVQMDDHFLSVCRLCRKKRAQSQNPQLGRRVRRPLVVPGLLVA